MMRLFVAVNLAPEVNERIGALRIPAPRGAVAWVRPENFHITLKFLGAVDEALVAPIADALRACAGDLPFEIGAKGIGTFPGRGLPPDVIWVGIEDPTGKLRILAEDIDRRLAALGLAPEKRPFSAHLTIGRAKGRRRQIAVPAEIEHRDFGGSLVREITLYRSETLPSGARYTPLAVIS